MAQYIVTVEKLNKRKAIPSTFPDDSSVVGVVYKGYTFEGTPVLPAAVPNPALGNWYIGADGYYYWGGGVVLNTIPQSGLNHFAAFTVMPEQPTPTPIKPLSRINYAIPEAAEKELNDQGFTNYMIDSFLKTAKQTATVVSSRLPGKVGIDLIEHAYDLKGFQIKAKSCNWGPMGGFICKLPPFNKYGSGKMDFNASYILQYLDSLDKFSGQKGQLATIEAKLTTARTYLATLQAADIDAPGKMPGVCAQLTINFTNDVNDTSQVAVATFITAINTILADATVTLEIKKQRILDIVNKAFNQNLLYVINIYRGVEQKKGKWSGENTIEGGAIPFIHLKRNFDTDTLKTIDMVKLMPGVDAASVADGHDDTIGSVIYGRAGNVTNENVAFDINNSTVEMEFILVQQENTAIWAIYHGDIFYKPEAGVFSLFAPGTVSAGTQMNDLFPDTIKDYPIAESEDITADQAKRNSGFLQEILTFATVPAPIKSWPVLHPPSPFTKTENDFYPVQGFVNPHPPYKLADVDCYKNAVSGDYDTFAYWPASSVNGFELTRLSEKMLNQSLKLYPDANLLFGIEFIPGFSELNPSTSSPLLKESAEMGNVNSIGNMVAGILNSTSRVLLKQDLEAKTTDFVYPPVNKAFHSDEGGRPGVMEIEFPIAVFFPETIKSIALKNLYIPGTPVTIPIFTGREPVDVLAGLIKTPEEFLQLMIELNTQTDTLNKYQVLVQSEWMIHLFYISLPTKFRQDFIGMNGSFSDFFTDLKLRDATGELISEPDIPDPKTGKTAKQTQLDFITKKLGEFAKIDKHHAEIYPVADNFNQPKFAASLQGLLSLKGNINAFNKTLKQFLKLAFQSKRPAQKRMFETMQVIFGLV